MLAGLAEYGGVRTLINLPSPLDNVKLDVSLVQQREPVSKLCLNAALLAAAWVCVS